MTSDFLTLAGRRCRYLSLSSTGFGMREFVMLLLAIARLEEMADAAAEILAGLVDPCR